MGSPPTASAVFIAHSADLDRRKMAADMLHFLGVLFKGSIGAGMRNGESGGGGSISALLHVDGQPYK